LNRRSSRDVRGGVSHPSAHLALKDRAQERDYDIAAAVEDELVVVGD